MSPRADGDRERMETALAWARRGLGKVWPNPTVGCVIVREGEVVGEGRTGDGGRPHAESIALAAAGRRARGATAYVTLEPCSHWGRTPPCCDALVEAGVTRVVIAAVDPDPRVDGQGVERLQAAGVEVVVGVGRSAARSINAGFFHRVRTGRPLVGRTEAGGDALVHLAERWDALGAHPAAPPESPCVAFALAHVRSEADASHRWRLTHDPRSPRDVGVARGRGSEDALRAALASLGELGLTRVLFLQDDPVGEALQQAGLVDREVGGYEP